MTESEYNEIEKVSRDYVDNFSFKDLAVNEIMPKYFEEETSNLTVGLNGMITEYVGTVAEDGFNTASTLLLETFPTRASMENSIYSNAAIFQLSNVFSQAARCDFLIVIPEKDIQRNFINTAGDPYSHFYLDKDTTIYVENIPFSLDYDIDIKAIYRETQKGYVYSARYKMPSNDSSVFLNTLSPIKDPYIKIRKTSNGLIVLQVNMGQYRRKVSYEQIIDNATINFPTVDVTYSEEIALMDVLYKEPGEETKQQLKLQVRFSQPSKEPFCYYRKINDGKLELSFTTKDTYFQPEFNSELTIITYSTMGEDGNFEMYDGENISLIKNNDNYQYDYPWAVSVKPLSGSKGGKKALSKEALQDLTVQGFCTANAITTAHDLQVYFDNYKHLHDSKVLFLKKRDDTAERLYSAFLYTKKDDYFYPTNTLTMDTNLLYLDKKEGGYYNIDPGFLFVYKETDIYRVIPVFYLLNRGVPNGKYFKKNSSGTYSLYNTDGTLEPEVVTEEYVIEEVKAGRMMENPKQYYVLENDDYVLFNPDGSRAERVYKTLDGSIYYKYKSRLYYLYDADGKLYEELEPVSQETIDSLLNSDSIIAVKDDVYNDPILMTEDELLLKFRDGGLSYDTKDMGNATYVDYLFESENELKARIDYLHYFETYRDKKQKPLMTISEYVFEYSFKDYKNDNGIDNRMMVFDTNIQEISNQHKFLFTNPFLMSVTKSAGLVGFYMTAVDSSSTLDFINENDADTITQFITYTLKLSRDVTQDKKYTFELSTLPSVSVTDEEPIIDVSTIYDPTNDEQFIEKTNPDLSNDLMRYDKSKLNKNDLRVILSFHKPETEEMLGYLEMIPVEKTGSEQFRYQVEFITDDYVTSDNEFRVTHRCPYCGAIKHGSTNTVKHKYTGLYICDTKDCPGNNGYKDGIINTLELDDIWLSMEDCIVRVNMLYRNPFDEEHPTDNEFAQFDKTYEGYRWTNVYSTISEPLSFMKPMNMLRTNIEYRDYYKKGVDALDCYIHDIPFLKYSLIAYRHEGPEITKVDEIDDIEKFSYFVSSYIEHYEILKEAQEYLRNNTNIDSKFYNTYGKSTNFVIGEDGELIDTVNIKISFDVWLVTNTDQVYAEDVLKTFIKDYVESINSEGTNDLYISNLIREIENNYAFVHHLKFRGINDYDTSYQAIKNRAISLNDLSKEERRHFVPDLLTVNRSNIHLSFEEIS